MEGKSGGGHGVGRHDEVGGEGGRMVLSAWMDAWGDNAGSVAHGVVEGCLRGGDAAYVMSHA